MKYTHLAMLRVMQIDMEQEWTFFSPCHFKTTPSNLPFPFKGKRYYSRTISGYIVGFEKQRKSKLENLKPTFHHQSQSFMGFKAICLLLNSTNSSIRAMPDLNVMCDLFHLPLFSKETP